MGPGRDPRSGSSTSTYVDGDPIAELDGMGRQLAGVGPRTKSTVGSTTTCRFAAVNLNVLGQRRGLRRRSPPRPGELVTRDDAAPQRAALPSRPHSEAPGANRRSAISIASARWFAAGMASPAPCSPGSRAAGGGGPLDGAGPDRFGLLRAKCTLDRCSSVLWCGQCGQSKNGCEHGSDGREIGLDSHSEIAAEFASPPRRAAVSPRPRRATSP